MEQVLAKLERIESGQEQFRKEVHERFNAVDEDLAFLKKQRNDDLISIMRNMNENITDVKSEIKHLSNLAQEHHKVIELLATRSIEQEAELKRIK